MAVADIERDAELDSITLTGIRARGFHGVYDAERADGQDFVIDATVWLDLAAAAASDSVHDTLHYGELAEEIAGAAQRDPVDLIETVAERIAAVVLSHGAARRVRVTVHKPQAPISVPFTDVAVTITRPARSGPADSAHTAVHSAVHSDVHTAVLAFGSNLGDREAILRAAIEDVRRTPGIAMTRVSDPIETTALTPTGIDENAPAYLNAVAIVTTSLPPDDLLDAVHRVEQSHGRVRGERWADRTLDIDIITYDALERADNRLTLPHPRAAEREFVLEPWLQADAGAVLPGHGRVADLLASLRIDGSRTDRLGER